jgi:hypothetical protein
MANTNFPTQEGSKKSIRFFNAKDHTQTNFPTQEGSKKSIRFFNAKDHTPTESKANKTKRQI